MSNETILGKVFVGGGETIGHLPDKVVSMLDLFMRKEEHFIVGDAPGCDLAFQTYLQSKGYTNVTVYCSGEKCRFNLGNWTEKHITVPDDFEELDFYREKDYALIKDCDGAMLVWERRSLAARGNIYHLKALGKPIFSFKIEHDCFKILRRKKADA